MRVAAISIFATLATVAVVGAAAPAGAAEPGARSTFAVRLAAATVAPPTAAPAKRAGLGARTYFVNARRGSDARSGSRDGSRGGSRGAPWHSIQFAVDHAQAGSVVAVAPGVYDSFTITRPLTVRGASRSGVVIRSNTAADLIDVQAPDSSVRSLTVAGCVPVAAPDGGIDDHPSSGIRVSDGASDTVIDRVTVRGGVQRGDAAYKIGCHGVFLHDADRVTVSNSAIYHNGSGIFVMGGGSGDRLLHNHIYANHAMIRNTPLSVNGNDDFGAIGIGFDSLTATPGPLAQGNRIDHNRAASYDYGIDGGGFEVFQASHVTMQNNDLTDNDDIIETGTSSPERTCTDNVFAHNSTRGVTGDAGSKLSKGMILRCAQDMAITDNVIRDANWWAFAVGGSDTFASSIKGLTITGNTVAQGYDQIFASEVDPGSWGATINDNTYSYACDANFATIPDAQLKTMTQWRQRTPYDSARSTAACTP